MTEWMVCVQEIRAILGVALGILAYVSSHIQFAAYLNIMYIPGSEELVVFFCAFIGALIGFLWYNAYPAQVFHGRYRFADHRWNYRCRCHHHPQGIDVTYPLRYLLCRKSECYRSGILLQARKAKRSKTTHLQAHSYTRQLPYAGKPTGPRMQVSSQEAKGCIPSSLRLRSASRIVTIILAALTIITLKIR